MPQTQNDPMAFFANPASQIAAGAQMLMDALNGGQSKKFELDDMTLLDLRQRVKSPRAVADKFGVSEDMLYDAYPEFRPQGTRTEAKPQQQQAEMGFFERLNAPREQLHDALNQKK